MRIIGIDPGSEISGIAMMGDAGEILHASNPRNTDVLSLLVALTRKKAAHIVMEDLSPYAGLLSPHTLSTANWIGELVYRIGAEGVKVSHLHRIARNSVKYWIYNTCPEICIPRIEKKLIAMDRREVAAGKRGRKTSSGEMRKPSFNFVDDRIVIAAIKSILDLPEQKRFQENTYGLKDHAWQALAAVLCYKHTVLECPNVPGTASPQGVLAL